MSIGLLLLLRNGDGDLVEDGKADHHAKGVRLEDPVPPDVFLGRETPNHGSEGVRVSKLSHVVSLVEVNQAILAWSF